MVKYLSVAAFKPPPKKDVFEVAMEDLDQSNVPKSNAPRYGDISQNKIIQALGFSSYSSGYRNLNKANEKRSLIADGRIER